MPLTRLDTGGIARSLAQIADRPDDHVDVFFELDSEIGVVGRADALTPQRRAEQGLAVRLLRDGKSWLASSDEVTPEAFADAVARVARARPGAVSRPPRSLGRFELDSGSDSSLRRFVAAVESAITERHAAFPMTWDLRHHRRVSRVLGAMLSPTQQDEQFFSCIAVTPWFRWGSLLLDLEPANVEAVAGSLTALFRARRAQSPSAGRYNLVLGPAAAAVLLHESVAHMLETDTLALSGDPEAAVGVQLAASSVEVVDDPTGAPAGVARSVDDEGMPAVRRWLLRGGLVEQPLADLLRGAASRRLLPGAARRGSRHLAPVPRSTHLELLGGTATQDELVTRCGDGLLVEEFSSGSVDPLSGRLRLDFSSGRRIEGGRPGEVVGAGSVVGSAADVLAKVKEVGADRRSAGAGWCAKSGHRLPVWATTPSVLLEQIEVGP